MDSYLTVSSTKSFNNLDDNLKLMVTDYLPSNDKVNLIDAFPPVIKQINTFDFRKCKRGLELFKKLTSVTKVLFPNDYDYYRLAVQSTKYSALGQAFDYGRKKIKSFSESTLLKDREAWNVLLYIKEIGPMLDGSSTIHEFEVNDNFIYEMVVSNPHLKIKLFFHIYHYGYMIREGPTRRALQVYSDQRIRNMITHLNVSKYVNDDLLPDFVFESVDHVTFTCETYEYLLNALRYKIRRLAPNVSKITFRLIMPCPSYANVLVGATLAHCLLSMTKLENLEIYICKQEENTNVRSKEISEEINNLVSIILSSESSLNRLIVQSAYDFRIPEVLDVEIKPGFKSICLSLSEFILKTIPAGGFVSKKSTTPASEFILEKNYMRIKNVQLPILTTFNKFNHVKHIDVVNNCKEYIFNARQDMKMIMQKLPRNRNVVFSEVNTSQRICLDTQFRIAFETDFVKSERMQLCNQERV